MMHTHTIITILLAITLGLLVWYLVKYTKKQEGFFFADTMPQCAPGSYLDNTTGTCMCHDLPTEVCPAGLTKLSTPSGPTCVTSDVCPAGTTFQILNGNPFCTAVTKCPDGSSLNKAGQCQQTSCPAGFNTIQLTSGSTACVAQPPECPAGYTAFKNMDGIMTCSIYPSCPEGLVVDRTNNTCIGSVKCPYGGTWDATSKQCIETTQFDCGTGFAWDGTGKCCLPSPNTTGAKCA